MGMSDEAIEPMQAEITKEIYDYIGVYTMNLHEEINDMIDTMADISVEADGPIPIEMMKLALGKVVEWHLSTERVHLLGGKTGVQ